MLLSDSQICISLRFLTKELIAPLKIFLFNTQKTMTDGGDSQAKFEMPLLTVILLSHS